MPRSSMVKGAEIKRDLSKFSKLDLLLEEGKEVEIWIDDIVFQKEQRAKHSQLGTLRQMRQKIPKYIGTLILLFLYMSTLVLVFLGVGALIGSSCKRTTNSPKTHTGWHAHRLYTRCIQFGNTEALVCANDDKVIKYYSSRPLVRRDLKGNDHPCILGVVECKKDAEKEIAQREQVKGGL